MAELEDVLKGKELAFVDIETTGSNPLYDKIIELAIVIVRDGEILESWSSLVNPKTRISEFISSYTGINNRMVADKPSFKDLAAEVHRRLEGRIFVAHNVSFDYGFLKTALGREAFVFNEQRICTVKLSRALYPQYRKHSLDALMERFDLACKSRHRALDDTMVMVNFWRLVLAELPKEEVVESLKKQLNKPGFKNPELEAQLAEIEDVPGVYLFYGEGNVPLYIGKSVHLHSRIASHFSSDYRSYRGRRLIEQVERIEIKKTAGDFGAQLLESALIKKMQPIYNRQLRYNRDLCTIRLEAGADGFLRVNYQRGDAIDPLNFENHFGLFKSHRQAQEFMEELVKNFSLCKVILGLETGGENGCFASRLLGNCAGACVGQETYEDHNWRLLNVLQDKKLLDWPFGGRVGIREKTPGIDVEQVHLVENWCYLGSVDSAEDLNDSCELIREPEFNADTYRILRKFIESGRGEIIDFDS